MTTSVEQPSLKIALLQQGMELKNTPFSVNEQFPHSIAERRHALYPTFKSQSREAECLLVDKLYINNQEFKDLKITTWL
jgi:hypothetical protein